MERRSVCIGYAMATDLLATLAARFDLATLDTESSHIAFIGADGKIVWTNAAWDRFGRANGADPRAIGLGTNYFDAVEGDLNPWLRRVASRCVTSESDFQHDYECSSDSVQRTFRMRMLPIARAGILIEHSPRVETGHPGRPMPADDASYRNAAGLIVMCSNCRRVKRVGNPSWEWVPEWVAREPTRVSHGLCYTCLEYYYAPDGGSNDRRA